MAKARGYKPEVWTDERVMDVSRDARLLWMGLWTFSCDSGHVEDSPAQLKARIFPGDDCTRQDVDKWLRELAGVGLITREGGVITTPNFRKHQKIDRRYEAGCTLVPGCAAASDQAKRSANAGEKRPTRGGLKLAN